jgi:hypothetical protein
MTMEQKGGCGTGCGCAGGQAELRVVDDGLRHDWSQGEIEALFAAPFNELMHQAQSVHRTWHDPNAVQVSTAAVDQDRRLPRRLRLLPAERALRHRP